MKRFSLLVTALTTLLVSACMHTHTVEPLTVDMHRTQAVDYEKRGSLKLLAFPPLTGSYKLVAWGNAAIGRIAGEQGISEIYFADLETFSILRIWNEYTVHVYGK